MVDGEAEVSECEVAIHWRVESAVSSHVTAGEERINASDSRGILLSSSLQCHLTHITTALPSGPRSIGPY